MVIMNKQLSLNERTYHCQKCSFTFDKDVNAAINIRNFAMRKLISNTVGTTGINACGDESSDLNDAKNCSSETIVAEARKILEKDTKNVNDL